jgi:hypothetical protein
MTTEPNTISLFYDSSTYHNQDKNVSTKKTSLYKYPVAHSITLQGVGFLYSSIKSDKHFGIPKVILSSNENQYPVNDYDGKYGTSNNTFSIPTTSKKHGDCLVEAINTDDFKEIIRATKWGTFQTDYKMFKYFRPDFYKDFLGKTSSCSAIKIQAVVRGHQTRKKYKKGGIGKKSRRNIW